MAASGTNPAYDENDNAVLITKKGLEQLKIELEHLKTVKRKEVSGRLKEAISYGDLSENSEYEEAKNEQAFVEGRILELEKKVKNAKIISERHTKIVSVQVGAKVILQMTKGKSEKEEYVIVGSTEADPFNNRISNESPIGEALLGKVKGDTVSVKTPSGKTEYKIVDLK